MREIRIFHLLVVAASVFAQACIPSPKPPKTDSRCAGIDMEIVPRDDLEEALSLPNDRPWVVTFDGVSMRLLQDCRLSGRMIRDASTGARRLVSLEADTLPKDAACEGATHVVTSARPLDDPNRGMSTDPLTGYEEAPRSFLDVELAPLSGRTIECVTRLELARSDEPWELAPEKEPNAKTDPPPICQAPCTALLPPGEDLVLRNDDATLRLGETPWVERRVHATVVTTPRFDGLSAFVSGFFFVAGTISLVVAATDDFNAPVYDAQGRYDGKATGENAAFGRPLLITMGVGCIAGSVFFLVEALNGAQRDIVWSKTSSGSTDLRFTF